MILMENCEVCILIKRRSVWKIIITNLLKFNIVSISLITHYKMLKLTTSLFSFSYQAKGTLKRVRLGRPGTSLKIGLLGMANIGKSSTFNILSNLNVPA